VVVHRLRGAAHDHVGVADRLDLVESARLDERVEAAEEPARRVTVSSAGEALGQRGEPDEVSEKGGNDLAFLAHHRLSLRRL